MLANLAALDTFEKSEILDFDTARDWVSDPEFMHRSRRWSWCRTALPVVLVRSMHIAGAAPFERVNLQSLANSFWPWAASLERDRSYEAVDPVDFAHFAAGLLLSNLLAAHPGSVTSPRRSDEVFALTRTVVTLLAAWRAALSPSTFQLHVDDQQSRQWTSYLENVAEDPSIAVPFLDSFTGLEPAWQYPLMIGERPAMRSAIDKLRSSGR